METILINGQPQQQLPVTDRAFHYGDGLFETIACLNGTPRFWGRHLARLQLGCERLKIPQSDGQQLLEEVTRLAQGEPRCVIKIIITRGSGGRGYRLPQPSIPTRVVLRYPYPDYPPAHRHEGVAIRLCETTLACNPRLAGIKHLNRLEQVMARSEWEDRDIAEGVMLDTSGNLLEGTMSNLFLVKEGVLHTPDLAHCGVAGIMREVVLQTAQQLNIPYQIGQLPASMLLEAEELFVTNSLIGLWPVNRYGQYSYPLGPITQQLQQALMPLLEPDHA